MTDSIIIQQEEIAPLKVVEREVLIDTQEMPVVIESSAIEVVTLEMQSHILDESPQREIVVMSEGGGGSGSGVSDHGALTGLGDDDHPQYVLHAEVDDVPVNGAITDPISSNWAFDHEAAADPHPGYLTPAEGNAAYAPISEPIAAAHITDTLDAHDASAISILDAALDFDATDVEGALAELQSDAEADAAALAAHLADIIDVHDHGSLGGLADDDHLQYILGDRAQWTDLTDGGETMLHTHPGGVSNLGDILAFAAAHG